jgi:hypothetical protein
MAGQVSSCTDSVTYGIIVVRDRFRNNIFLVAYEVLRNTLYLSCSYCLVLFNEFLRTVQFVGSRMAIVSDQSGGL